MEFALKKMQEKGKRCLLRILSVTNPLCKQMLEERTVKFDKFQKLMLIVFKHS